LSWFLSQAKNVGLAFVGREIVELVFVGRGNRLTRFYRKRKLSKWVLSQAKNVGLAFVAREIVNLVLLRKEIVKPSFVEKGKCQTGFVERKIVE